MAICVVSPKLDDCVRLPELPPSTDLLPVKSGHTGSGDRDARGERFDAVEGGVAARRSCCWSSAATALNGSDDSVAADDDAADDADNVVEMLLSLRLGSARCIAVRVGEREVGRELSAAGVAAREDTAVDGENPWTAVGEKAGTAGMSSVGMRSLCRSAGPNVAWNDVCVLTQGLELAPCDVLGRAEEEEEEAAAFLPPRWVKRSRPKLLPLLAVRWWDDNSVELSPLPDVQGREVRSRALPLPYLVAFAFAYTLDLEEAGLSLCSRGGEFRREPGTSVTGEALRPRRYGSSPRNAWLKISFSTSTLSSSILAFLEGWLADKPCKSWLQPGRRCRDELFLVPALEGEDAHDGGRCPGRAGLVILFFFFGPLGPAMIFDDTKRSGCLGCQLLMG